MYKLSISALFQWFGYLPFFERPFSIQNITMLTHVCDRIPQKKKEAWKTVAANLLQIDYKIFDIILAEFEFSSTVQMCANKVHAANIASPITILNKQKYRPF